MVSLEVEYSVSVHYSRGTTETVLGAPPVPAPVSLQPVRPVDVAFVMQNAMSAATHCHEVLVRVDNGARGICKSSAMSWLKFLKNSKWYGAQKGMVNREIVQP